MSLALARPDLVDKAILIATGGLHRYTEQEIAANLERLSEQKLMQFTPAIHAALFGRLFALQGTQAQRRYIAKQDANLTRPDYPDYVRVLHGCMRLSLQLCLLERLPALRMPVLLIQGELDPVIRAEWVRGAHPRFRDARLLALPEVGHVPQLEAPSTVVEAIRGFTGSD